MATTRAAPPRVGDAAAEIVRVAEESGADLIVLGARLNPLKRLVLGSVGTKVLHQAARKIVDEAETILLHGRAADTFVRAVSDQGATLAAVGSHEISRAAGILIGSVATRALHEAPCSVLVARAGEWPWPRSIVAGIDGSDGSLAAAAVAQDIPTRTRSSVRFLVARGASPADIATEALTNSGYGLAFSDEKPVPALLEAAQGANLVVVGSRGLTGLRALGSVSERVAHHAPCSLLVVRDL